MVLIFRLFRLINFVHSPIMTFSRVLFPSISLQLWLGLCAWGERVVEKLLFVPPDEGLRGSIFCTHNPQDRKNGFLRGGGGGVSQPAVP